MKLKPNNIKYITFDCIVRAELVFEFRKSDSGVHALNFYIILPLAYTSISFLYTSNAKFANKTEKGSYLFIIEAKKKVLQINLVRCIDIRRNLQNPTTERDKRCTNATLQWLCCKGVKFCRMIYRFSTNRTKSRWGALSVSSSSFFSVHLFVCVCLLQDIQTLKH